MSDVPMQIIVAAFQDENEADQALKTLKEAKKEKLISIDNAAVIRKDEEGKLHIKETADMGGGKGASLTSHMFPTSTKSAPLTNFVISNLNSILLSNLRSPDWSMYPP